MPQPPPAAEPLHLVELGARLLEIANWRDLQTELRSLPPGWSRRGELARVCVVEPAAALEGGVMGIDPARAADLIARPDARVSASTIRAS